MLFPLVLFGVREVYVIDLLGQEDNLWPVVMRSVFQPLFINVTQLVQSMGKLTKRLIAMAFALSTVET